MHYVRASSDGNGSARVWVGQLYRYVCVHDHMH